MSPPDPSGPAVGTREPGAPGPLVASVVIRARDEVATIGSVLERVLAQEDAGPFEVIVIDSGSTDGTLEVVRRFPVRLHEISPEAFSFGGALNLGAGLARAPVCVHLSAHCRPADRRWLSALLAPLAERDVVATFGRQVPIPGVNPFEEIQLERIFPPGDLRPGARAYFSNANCAIRREVLLVRPFDERIAIMEDALWLLELPHGARVAYVPGAVVYHSHPLRWRYWLTRYAKDGLAYRYMQARYGHDLLAKRKRGDLGRLLDLAVELVATGRALVRRGYYRHLLAFPAFALVREVGLRRGLREGRRRHPEAAPPRPIAFGGAPPAPGHHRRDGLARPRLAAIVVNYRTAETTLCAVASIAASRRPVEEVIVVENGSADGSEATLRRALPADAVVSSDRNLGFSGGVNVGLRTALARGAELILLLNSDAVLDPDCVGRLEAALDGDAQVGIAGPVLLAAGNAPCVTSLGISFSPATGRMRHEGFGRSPAELDPETQATCRVDGVSGCVMLIRREVFERIGLFAEEYFFSFEDLDFCLRARAAGLATLCVGGALAYHEGGRSIGLHSERRLYFATRNHLLLARRRAPAASRISGLGRSGAILALNLAYAVTRADVPLGKALGGVIRGAVHHARSRYGDGP